MINYLAINRLSQLGERVHQRERGVIPGCTYLPEGDQPERYSGPIPSYSCRAVLRRMEEEHQEWVERRALLMEG